MFSIGNTEASSPGNRQGVVRPWAGALPSLSLQGLFILNLHMTEDLAREGGYSVVRSGILAPPLTPWRPGESYFTFRALASSSVQEGEDAFLLGLGEA